MAIEKHYTLEEISEIIGIAERTLYREIKEGRLRARKLSKNWRVSESDLQAYIDSVPANIPKQQPTTAEPTAEEPPKNRRKGK